MKKKIVAVFFMSVVTIVYSMEQSQEMTLCKNALSELHDDYKTYLQNRLYEYKKLDNSAPFNMDDLVAMSVVMTGSIPRDAEHHSIYRIKDEEGDYFIHSAVQKRDVSTVEWIYNNITHGVYALQKNTKRLTPFDICCEQLSLNICDKDSSVMKIFNYIIMLMVKKSDSSVTKICSLRKIIELQLLYKKLGCELPLSLDTLYSLIPEKNSVKRESSLRSFYQQSRDSVTGNTFTHVLVENESADELFEWLTKGLISFEKNKEGLTALDLALHKFRCFTQNTATIETSKTSFNRRRCCLFMLLNYLKNKGEQSAPAHFDNCCSKHGVA